MQFTAAQISKLIDGQIEGNETETVNSFGKIEEAQTFQLTFFSNPKYEDFLYSSTASIIIIKNDYVLKQPVRSTLIRVVDPYNAFVTLLSNYQEMMRQQMAGIQQPSFISPTALLGENIFIGAFSYVGENVKIGNNTKIYPNTFIGDNVQIGKDCILHAGVKIYFDCLLKDNVIIHAGTVIGSDGFGYVPQANGSLKKVPQIGNVIIENNVEIGANTTIDRATMGSTIVKEGSKLDNLIQIAHNVEVGKSTVIAAQVGVSGSTKIGDHVMIGGQAGFAEHLQIADGTKVGGGAGVTRSVKTQNCTVNDTPAFDYFKSLRSQSIYRNLPELEKRVKELETLVKLLIAERV